MDKQNSSDTEAGTVTEQKAQDPFSKENINRLARLEEVFGRDWKIAENKYNDREFEIHGLHHLNRHHVDSLEKWGFEFESANYQNYFGQPEICITILDNMKFLTDPSEFHEWLEDGEVNETLAEADQRHTDKILSEVAGGETYQ